MTSFRRSRILSGAVFASVLALGSVARADNLDAAFANDFDLDDQWLTTDDIADLGDVTCIRFLPDGRMLVGLKGGGLWIRHTDGSVVKIVDFPAATDSEQGLLGVTPTPDFATSNHIVVYWSRKNGVVVAGASPDPVGDENRHIVAVYDITNETLDPLAPVKVLVDHLAGPANHDGGALSFAPNGDLFIGVGDTGCNESPPAPPTVHQNRRATSFDTANGKILRVRIDTPDPIPADNPFVGYTGDITAIDIPYSCGHCKAGDKGCIDGQPQEDNKGHRIRTEVYAVGLRNPFRIFVDPKTSFVWVGDVGETTWEEIDVIQDKGWHMGWPFIEGPTQNTTDMPDGQHWPLNQCNNVTPALGDCHEPTLFCNHGGSGTLNGVAYDGDCQSITGGVIVDDCHFPALFQGKYVFGDNIQNHLWVADLTAARDGIVGGAKQTFAQVLTPVELTVGTDGALYVAARAGRVDRISPKDPTVATCDVGMGGAGGMEAGGADQGGAGGVDQAGAGGDVSGGANGTAGTTAAGAPAGGATAGGASAGGKAQGGTTAAGSGAGGKAGSATGGQAGAAAAAGHAGATGTSAGHGGAVTAGHGGATSAGHGGAAGAPAAAAAAPSGDSGGCGCRVVEGGPSAPGILSIGALGALFAARRRQRRTP